MKRNMPSFRVASKYFTVGLLVATTTFVLAGSASTASGVEHAFLYSGGVMTDLKTFGGTRSEAQDINDSGQVVGFAKTADGEEHAFLYSDGVMTDLGTLGGTSSRAIAINDSGQVVGYAKTADGEENAFLYSNGVMTDLGTLGRWGSYAAAINASGQVAGNSYTAAGEYHAFLYSGGVMADLGTLGGGWSEAIAINDAGQVVGISEKEDSSLSAFLYSDGVMTDLGTLGAAGSRAEAINDAGQVVGLAAVPGEPYPNVHGFLYSSGVMTDLGTLGGSSSEAYAINDAGQVVGVSQTADYTWHAFLYSHGVMTDLDTLGGLYSWAVAINASGQVAGSFYTAAGEQSVITHAFLYSNGVMTDLGTLGGEDGEAMAINDAGQVVGVATYHPEEAAISCPAEASETCLSAAQSLLLIKDSVSDDIKDQIKWKWRHGDEVGQSDLGNPQSDTRYALCVYDSGWDDYDYPVTFLVGGLQIGPNANWRDATPDGWEYVDKIGSQAGVRKVRVATGGAGKTKAELSAKGTNIPMPGPCNENYSCGVTTGLRLTVQLFNDATPTCWTSMFYGWPDLTTVIKNDGTQFKAKTP